MIFIFLWAQFGFANPALISGLELIEPAKWDTKNVISDLRNNQIPKKNIYFVQKLVKAAQENIALEFNEIYKNLYHEIPKKNFLAMTYLFDNFSNTTNFEYSFAARTLSTNKWGKNHLKAIETFIQYLKKPKHLKQTRVYKELALRRPKNKKDILSTELSTIKSIIYSSYKKTNWDKTSALEDLFSNKNSPKELFQVRNLSSIHFRLLNILVLLEDSKNGIDEQAVYQVVLQQKIISPQTFVCTYTKLKIALQKQSTSKDQLEIIQNLKGNNTNCIYDSKLTWSQVDSELSQAQFELEQSFLSQKVAK